MTVWLSAAGSSQLVQDVGCLVVAWMAPLDGTAMCKTEVGAGSIGANPWNELLSSVSIWRSGYFRFTEQLRTAR